MPTSKTKIFLNTVFWGFVLWLFGYVLGFFFFFFAPKDLIGWFIMPFGTALTLWVLIKKIKREQFMCYVGLGVIWAVMAFVLDYFFLVKMLNFPGYYKVDVFLYYLLTFALPLVAGWHKLKSPKATSSNIQE